MISAPRNTRVHQRGATGKSLAQRSPERPDRHTHPKTRGTSRPSRRPARCPKSGSGVHDPVVRRLRTSHVKHFTKPALKKLTRITIWTLGALIIGCAALFCALVKPGGSGVLASLRLPDGSEYMVTQRCNWSPGEPYTVAFYMRAANGPWGWCYIDHEADRWHNVAMTYDATSDTIAVTERGTWQAALERKRSAFSNGRSRVDAPQCTPSQPPFAFR